ncbi:MAG: hypothetical protein IPL53_21805, partial [Ignavibacteria bacterium]|nr:hypothetical protein [Ignavibacteria bacterium]
MPLTGGFNSPNHLGDNPDGVAEVTFGTLANASIGGGITPDPMWNTDPNSVKCGSCHGDPVTGKSDAEGFKRGNCKTAFCIL